MKKLLSGIAAIGALAGDAQAQEQRHYPEALLKETAEQTLTGLEYLRLRSQEVEGILWGLEYRLASQIDAEPDSLSHFFGAIGKTYREATNGLDFMVGNVYMPIHAEDPQAHNEELERRVDAYRSNLPHIIKAAEAQQAAAAYAERRMQRIADQLEEQD